MYNIHTILVKDIPQPLYRKLYRLNRRRCGEMRKTLVKCRFYGLGVVHYVMENKSILGWVLQFPQVTETDLHGSNIHVYVRASHRRQGIGSALMCIAEWYRRDTNPRQSMNVYPWERGSTAFYSNLITGGVLSPEYTYSRNWPLREFRRPIK